MRPFLEFGVPVISRATVLYWLSQDLSLLFQDSWFFPEFRFSSSSEVCGPLECTGTRGCLLQSLINDETGPGWKISSLSPQQTSHSHLLPGSADADDGYSQTRLFLSPPQLIFGSGRGQKQHRQTAISYWGTMLWIQSCWSGFHKLTHQQLETWSISNAFRIHLIWQKEEHLCFYCAHKRYSLFLLAGANTGLTSLTPV